MNLVSLPSTGTLIGLARSLSQDERLERIRKGSEGNSGKWFAIFSALGLAYRTFRSYRFGSQYPECPSRVLAQAVVQDFPFPGSFESGGLTPMVKRLWSETKLLVTCAYNVFTGNSVRYEFGLRWVNQTSFDVDFQDEYLTVLDVLPVPLGGVSFQELVYSGVDEAVCTVLPLTLSQEEETSEAESRAVPDLAIDAVYFCDDKFDARFTEAMGQFQLMCYLSDEDDDGPVPFRPDSSRDQLVDLEYNLSAILGYMAKQRRDASFTPFDLEQRFSDSKLILLAYDVPGFSRRVRQGWFRRETAHGRVTDLLGREVRSEHVHPVVSVVTQDVSADSVDYGPSGVTEDTMD